MSAGPIDSSKPSVAFLIDRWDPERGGAERAMAQLAEHLSARGYRVLAVACEHADGAPGEVVRVSTSGITRSAREKRLARNLVGAARAHGADITVGCRHLYECDLYWPHGGAHRVTLRQRNRARGIEGDPRPRGRHATFVELERELLERGGARKVACVSRMVMEEFANEWPACRERLCLVENGVDLVRFHTGARSILGQSLRAELGVDAGEPLLLFIARNPRLKGWWELYRALGSLIEHGDRDWKILAVTPKPVVRPRRMPESIAKLGVSVVSNSGCVMWRDTVDPLAAYSAADLCVHPTWRDTSGLVVLEALACGIPVITTCLAGAAEVVGSAGTVLDERVRYVKLRSELQMWLERVRDGNIDRDAIRARVAHRGVETWLAQLEALVIELARGGP